MMGALIVLERNDETIHILPIQMQLPTKSESQICENRHLLLIQEALRKEV